MAQECIATLNDSKVFKDLKTKLGTDTEVIKAVASVFDGEKFNDDFVKYYKEAHKKNPDINKSASTLANSIYDYLGYKNWTVSRTAKKASGVTDVVQQMGYDSFNTREEGKAHMAVRILSAYKSAQENQLSILGNPLDYYIHAAVTAHNEHCFQLCSEIKGTTIDTIRTEYNARTSTPEKLTYLEGILGAEGAGTQARNSLALWKELHASSATQKAYILSLFNNKILADVLAKSKQSADERKDAMDADGAADTNGMTMGEDSLVGDVDLDKYIEKVTNEQGKFSSYLKHASERIRTYFNTLPKITAPTELNGSYPKATDNAFGIGEVMSAEQCLDMLYGGNDNFSDIPTMVAYVEQVAKTVPGFEAFAILAEDLRTDLDFAAEVFRTFRKVVMDRYQVVHNNGDAAVRVTTEQANKRSAMLFELFNDAKSSVSQIGEVSSSNERLSKIEDLIKKLPGYLKKINDVYASDEQKTSNTTAFNESLTDIKDELSRLIKSIFPSVEPNAVIAYIDLGNNGAEDLATKIANVNRLVSAVKEVLKAMPSSIQAFNAREAKIQEWAKYNRTLLREAREGNWHADSEYKNMAELYSSDYLTSAHKAACEQLRDILVDYSIVATQRDLPNVKGNHVSAVINNSFITELHDILDSNPEVIEQWGREKYRDKRYRLNPTLFSQYDENGEELSKGIFQYDKDGNVTLTDEGPNLLKIYMLDGASDMDSGANMTYDEMTFGDFCPTAFIQFFGTEVDRKLGVDIANYFPRIPSDATTMYSLRAPRYSTADLYKYDDPEGMQEIMNTVLDSVAMISSNQYFETFADEVDEQGNVLSTKPAEVIEDYHYLARLLTGRATLKVRNDHGGIVMISENRGLLSLEYENNTYVVEFDVVEQGNDIFLSKGELKAVTGRYVKETTPLKESMPDEVYRAFVNNIKKNVNEGFTWKGVTYEAASRSINRNSKIFKLFRSQFKQEMIGCALAIDHYFETDDNGCIVNANKDATQKTIEPKADNTKGYNNYHTVGGKVLHGKPGSYDLKGKAFHSDKFTLTYEEEQDGKTVRVKRNFLDEVITMEDNEIYQPGEQIPEGKKVGDSKQDGRIHLLYEGSDRNNHLKVIKNEAGEVVDVEFSDAQQQLIDDKLEEWLNAYLTKARVTVGQNAKFVKGVPVTDETIEEFACNTALFLMQCDDLLDGDTGFYKDVQTVLKRAKQYEGSGMLYSMIDRIGTGPMQMSYLDEGEFTELARDENGKLLKNEDGSNKTKQTKIQDFFNSPIKDSKGRTVLDKDGKPIENPLKGCKSRRTFTAVTVHNTSMTNVAALEPLVAELQKDIKDENGKVIKKGMSHEDAMDTIYGKLVIKDGKPVPDETAPGKFKRKGGFTDVTVNDAQSYITFDEWVRRIAGRGQLKQYLPLIRKLLDPNSVLTAADIQQFVQVQKNFYYDMHYDEEYGITVPRQIKNAEFVLVPRLIQGTQLEKVYNLMKEAGVDQLNTLETSKAANETVLTLWDNNGDLTGADSFVENVGKISPNRKTYSYRYLYTQQETPQHMDATNKIGIQISKKIIDNIPPDHPLYEKKIEYMNLLIQNIRDSYETLLRDLKIPVDSNGNIRINTNGEIVNEKGEVQHFDLEMLYEKLAQEMRRLGVDDNMIDYILLDKETGLPKMPALINTVLVKFESIFQSIFNNNITKQKLPGFHAAQVTNVGWRALSDSVEKYSYSKDLRYHPVVDGKVQPYVEVMLPASMFGIDRNSEHYRNMTDEEIIKELEAKGLDIVMGYRIPTEGKQSVCNMKIVGFTDDAYGSTIVVPNDWVAQTGSDFDIDSVYGIKYETYKNKKGELFKVEYLDDKHEPSVHDYYNYATRLAFNQNIESLRDELDDINDDIEDKVEFYNEKSPIFRSLKKKQKEQFNALPKDVQDVITKNNHKINKKYDYAKTNAVELKKLEETVKAIKKVIRNTQDGEYKTQLNEYAELLSDLIHFTQSNDVNAFRGSRNSLVNNIIEENIESISSKTKAAGGLTFEEYKAKIKTSQGAIELNSRRARNNKILDNMKDILSDPTSLEENLSRSNFEDIIEARNRLINKNSKTEREGRSPYDPFDQMRFQEDAISGTHLKGISVSMDTFCSVCNTVRPTLTRPIKIVYNTSDISNSDNFTHGEAHDGKILVSHDTYGWSKGEANGNRNIVGKLITVYSSETTAHILDAVKEGNVPGVNVFTFPAYKTLVNIGSDYNTAIAFIMQPGVQRIVDEYNANNSVFAHTIDNPVHQAIEKIARELGVVTKDGTPIAAILNSLNLTFGKRFNEIFKQPGQNTIEISLKDAASVPLLVDELVKNLQDGAFTDKNDKLLFDLGVVLAFHNLNKTASEIQSIAQCCNPDKFGAKQTIYATNKVFEDIHRHIFSYNAAGEKLEEKKKGILEVDGKHILAAIYPGADDADVTIKDPAAGILKGDISKSKYRTLAAYLKYASGLSTVLSRFVFKTQDPAFVYAVKHFSDVIVTTEQGLSEDVYNDVQKYILADFYNKCRGIRLPIGYSLNGSQHIHAAILENDPRYKRIATEEGKKKWLEANENDPNYEENLAADEKCRVFGFGHDAGISIMEWEDIYELDANGKEVLSGRRPVHKPFTVANFYSPTEEELDMWCQLSPAQKVEWLKKNLADPEIFGLYQVTLSNGRERGWRAGSQTIEYRENRLSPNTVYKMFKDAFFNENPLIQLAAIDLIKYSIFVEGLNLGSRNVSKTIANEPLLNEFGDDGIGLIDSVLDDLSDLGTWTNDLADDSRLNNIYEQYLRSHPETRGIKKLVLSKKNKTTYKINTIGKGSYGMLYIAKEYDTIGDSPTTTADAWTKRMVKAGLIKAIESSSGDVYYKNSRYIRVINGDKNFLYRVRQVRDGFILYPLTNLEKNEHGRWSAKQSNNLMYPSKEIYEAVIDAYEEANEETRFDSDFIEAVKEKQKENKEWGKYWFTEKTNYVKEYAAREFNLTEEAKEGISGMASVLDKIVTHFSQPLAPRLYIFSPALADRIFTPGVEYGSIQTVKLPQGDKKTVLISKLDTEQAKHIENTFLKSSVTDEDFNEQIKEVENSQIANAIKNAREAKLKHMQRLFVVEEYQPEEAFASAHEEASARSLKFVSVDINQGFEPAIEMQARLNAKGIKNEETSLQNNSLDVHRELAKYAQQKAQQLVTRFNYFEGNNSMLSDEVQLNLARKGEAYINRYLQTLNEIKAFVEVFGEYISLDMTSEDPELKFFIDKIKEFVQPVTKLDINAAAHKFGENYLSKLSTNPLIVDKVISVFDGYWKTSGAMWMFHDIMENGNPLLQIVGKDIMGNLEAKRIATEREVREFRKAMRAIIDAAAAEGKTVDFDKFIDKNGRIIQDYIPAFVDELDRLRNDVRDKGVEFGRGSIEHLRAKFEYDKFKATFVNQEAAPEYYIQKLNYDNDALEQMPEFYEAYMKAWYRKMELLEYRDEVGLSDEQEKELAICDNIIYLLRGNKPVDNTTFEGGEAERIVHETIGDMPVTEYMQQSEYLNDYIQAIGELNDEYFEREAVFGFEELLETHLKTIADFEKRENGIPTVPSSVLARSEQYQAAKKWIRENAYFDLSAKFDGAHRPQNAGARIKRALSYLNRNSRGRNASVRKYIGELEEQKGISIVDEYGVINPNLLTQNEIDTIRILSNNVGNSVRLNPYVAPEPAGPRVQPHSDRVLISMGPKDSTIYNKAFYDNISRRGRKGALTLQEAQDILVNGDPDARYHEIVEEINDILMPLYRDGVVHIEDIPVTQEGVLTLKRLGDLYQELKNIDRNVELSDEEEQRRIDFIKEETEYDEGNNETILAAQMVEINNHKQDCNDEDVKAAYDYALQTVLFERDKEGEYVVDEETHTRILNRALYATIKPKNPDSWIDHKYTDAINTVNRYYHKQESVYYHEAFNAAKNRDKTEPGYFERWYNENHYYNPETGKVEALDIWQESVIDYETIRLDDALEHAGVQGYETKIGWRPIGKQSQRKVIDGQTDYGYIRAYDMRNQEYDPNAGIADNFANRNLITGETQTEWSNREELNPYERQMRDLLRNTLINSVDLETEKQHFKKGYLPTQMASHGNIGKRVLKEAGKTMGFVLDKQKEVENRRKNVGYEHDRVPPLPMKDQLFSREAGSQTFDVHEPTIEEFANRPNPQGEFETAHAEWERAKEEVDKHNEEVHQAILDRDWERVISNFLLKQGERRAIQQEKDKMYYTLNMLKQQQAYERTHDGYGKIAMDEHGYVTSVDDNLIKAFETFIRRMLNNEYKDNTNHLTNAGTRLQSFTSANYMMANFKGGIANWTVGEMGILSEAAAREFIDRKAWAFGTAEWHKGIPSYFQGMYKEEAYSKQDAIIKLFKVVDYDELSGISTEVSMEKYAERLRNAMFSPQTIGEHYMQNSVLFAMLKTHKLVELNEDVKGVKCTFMTKNEYLRYKEAEMLNEILDDEQRVKLQEIKDQIRKDAKTAADYAWWRRDILTDFIYLRCTDAQIKEFQQKKKAKHEQYLAEFEEKEDMYSQIELGEDGFASYREGSKLQELSERMVLDGKVTAADLIVGQFSERVRKVNNKIHGVYNKKGRAYIENKWYGGLVMQYHKHLPTGILKRYRSRGYYNETRGAVEKGIIASSARLFTLNAEKIAADQGWTKEELRTFKGVQKLLAHSLSYLMQLKVTWNILPEYDRANIRRNLGDLIGVTSGLALVCGLKALHFGDDDDDSVLGNLMLYEADRLASECFLYNPLGLWSESKTLMSTPIAGESIINDALSATKNIINFILGDEEDDGLYHTGQFAGRHKLAVYIERRTPIWNGIRSIRDLPDNNRYFKRGQTVVGLFNVRKWFDD